MHYLHLILLILNLLFFINVSSNSGCNDTQFQCACGEPQCISKKYVGDGIAHCQDASDETAALGTDIIACADGTASRKNPKYHNQTFPFCGLPNPCLPELGQVCLVLHGTWRCVCKLGTIRPPGPSIRCIPVEALPQSLTNRATTNCSELIEDLNLLYNNHFGSGLHIEAINATKNHTNKLMREDPQNVTDFVEIDNTSFNQESLPEVYKRFEDDGSCNPNNLNDCKNIDGICAKSENGYKCECKREQKLIDGKCITLIDECANSTLNDCDKNALCMDNDLSYECLCREGYIDTSPNPSLRPGLKCRKLINECNSPLQNDCSQNAYCIDKPIGFTCRCNNGFIDMSEQGAKRPGRKCQQLINECKNGTAKCDPRAICTDTAQSYHCKCPPGFLDASPDPVNEPGRICAQLLTDCDASSCSNPNSQCVETVSGSVCQCKPVYVDSVESNPGQNCIKSKGNDPCQDYSLHDCDKVAECFSEQPGYFQCRCPKGFVDLSPDKRFPGRKCQKSVDECSLGTYQCDSNADCVDTAEGYTCRCKSGWTDVSADPQNAPGRHCRKGNQCANVDCASEAECRETAAGPICQCGSGFVDISRQHGRPPGRVCRVVVDECKENKHDCSSHASCIDTAEAFTCRCNDGFRDDSPNRSRPGRICNKADHVPQAPECNVNDPMSCDKSKAEVCLFIDSTYKCTCPQGFGRLPDGRCLARNECENSRLNDCSPDADCIDNADGYTCQCKSGFADISTGGKTGRLCRRRVNECASPQRHHVDCDSNAVCVDTEEGYSCRCRPGFADISEAFNRLPGRKCVEAINECLDTRLNQCSENAICEDAKEGYICSCRHGFVDASPNITHYPGRICNKPRNPPLDAPQTSSHLDSCNPKDPRCGNNAICTDRKNKGQFICECAESAFRHNDGSCRLSAACDVSNDCDKNAVCANIFDSFKCQCRPGYIDLSPDPETRPGRYCKELVNECATNAHDCSPFAECIDATDGYACVCTDGFSDTSSTAGLLPGRKCSNSSNECLDRSTHTCDDNADCIDTPDGYNCQCISGYVDVSSSANLPPGRVCTVQTTCPKQKTDLMFLIDGSGSIGSYVFKHEVLRFIKEFVELFDIGLDRTRVGLIQYSDQIRHEFDLNQYSDKNSLLHAIESTHYLTGLTRTGAAIQHMVMEGFSERRGARPISTDVSRVAIVITDGRSQDNVTEPAKSARNLQLNTFAIGVTDHVLASELETIAGSPHRWFYVDRFKDLDMRLRSLIQKMACPAPEPQPRPSGVCNPNTQTGCDRSLNEICVEVNGKPRCQCPKEFQRHPITRVCGGDLCNPQVLTSCPHPEVCTATPFGNFRCICPADYARDMRTGVCTSTKEKPEVAHNIDSDCANGGPPCPSGEQCVRNSDGSHHCACSAGLERNRSGKCAVQGSCDPNDANSCDQRKREHCLMHASGNYFICQCSAGEHRHPATDICLRNECLTAENDCDRSARCIDTDDGYICVCPHGFLDQSSDPINRPGRKCTPERNECLDGTHHCSPDAICTDTPEGYVCRCKAGFIDFSPNPQNSPGIVCKQFVNECARPELNNCDQNAICIDTSESYKCMCKNGFTDLDELRNPGRHCQKVQQNERCLAGRNDCDKNARCVQRGDNEFSCLCPPDFRDKSPDPINRPGRVCIPLIPECDNPTLNDCDSPDRAICTDTDEGYLCRCRQGFLDISPNIQSKPGRLCKQLENECAMGTHDCARDGGICEDTPDSYTCRCAINYLDVSFDRVQRPGRKCKRLIDECATGQNDCSPNGICTDTEDSYICACPSNYIDVSPNPSNKPGRRCLPLINECAKNMHDCSPNADCEDTPDSYKCICRDDFVDESPDQSRPGRVCRPALVDECRLGKHDCSRDAECHDLPQGYTCQCRAEFLDESPNRITHPGRKCVPRPTPPPDECRVDVSTSCKVELNEVCRIIDGKPKCACPINYNRDSRTNACTVINECQFPQLNDCHPSARCIDQQDGYTCECRQGFKDVVPNKPGRNCQPLVNECQFPHLNDCHQNAQCIDKEEGYDCKCNQGFKDLSPQNPGRICQQMINECSKPELNSCDKNANCFDMEDGYRCECKQNYLDVSPSPTLPGRACRALVNECANPKLNDCDKAAKCTDTVDSYTCQCPPNSKDISPNQAFPGRVCLVFENECLTGKHDCDQNAMCHDNEQSFTCECKTGFTDRSPNKLTRPGRVCVKLVDECAENRHTCSAQADCRDLEEGYTCECRDGYIDRSPNLLTQPGRVCGTPEVCPSNHECSSAAVCEPLGGNKYQCTCIQGYIDQSPQGTQGRICVRNNACRDPRLNNCSRNAVCYDEPKGYRCECIRGYLDRSPEAALKGRVCEPPPPPTPPPRHPCQDPNLNDCHAAGACRATGPTSYTCECLPGYVDRSPDASNKPGRVCVLTEPICLDSNRNDCDPAAICSETQDADGYTCRCRDGYVDQSPDTNRRPGRICVAQVNECLDKSLNDCDPLAVCEDLPDGYTCRCPVNSIDQSPDTKRQGRKCFLQVDECANPTLNNCSRFADCIDKKEGYECKCRSGYHDENPRHPGTVCNYIINECDSPNLNDCHRHAECMDLPGGYTCRCRSPYRDEGPKERPGRLCRFNECASPNTNDCDQNAVCQDTDDGYYCSCKEGFYDASPNASESGRVCNQFQPVEPVTVVTASAIKEGIPCGPNNYCSPARNEVCIGGNRCGCRPGEARASPTDRCQPVERVPLAVRVVSRGQEPLYYSSEFGNDKNEAYAEITNEFKNDVGHAIGSTAYAQRYVNTDVSFITHPKTVNSSWPEGLLFNFSVGATPTGSPIDVCDLWDEFMKSVQRTNGAIGGGRLNVAADVDLLDPCYKPPPAGDLCNGQVCNAELGEVCIAGSLCGCVNGEKRASPKDKCRPVEAFPLPLWVIRKNQHNLVYNETFGNPLDELNKKYVQSFEKGVAECYPHTVLKNAFVTAEVNDIVDPMVVNASMDTGIYYNATMYFRKGQVRIPSDSYHTLLRYIIDRNNYQIGNSGLYINPYQPDPYSACYKNNCHPKGRCIELGPNAYRCECGNGYRDKNPNDPGHHCLPINNFNECENPEDNECSENARCIDLEHLYKCECLPGFTDAAKEGAVPGSVCVLDYCSDVNFCPANSTCVNMEQQAECQCNRGFVDIRKSDRRLAVGFDENTICLRSTDVNECLLGLHNCSGVAECVDLKVGYTCRCPDGYVDGNPSEPGRVCGALLCDLCNQHGDCVHNAQTNNVTCICHEGYSGEYCALAPSSVPLILLILLALLFLLLTLCCLLYLCTKCHCFKRYREPLFTYRRNMFPFGTLDQSASSDSGADFSAMSGSGDLYNQDLGIPRAKVKDTHRDGEANAMQLANYLDDMHIPRARLHDGSSLASGDSEFTIAEEIERRVITDVTRTETRTITTENADGTTTTTEFNVYPPTDGGISHSSSSHHVSMRERSANDEQERGESVAEFSNGGHTREWHSRGRSGEYSEGRHNTGYVSEQDDRSVNSYSTEDDGIYDKHVLVKNSRDVDPSQGYERYKSEITTKKSSTETYNK